VGSGIQRLAGLLNGLLKLREEKRRDRTEKVDTDCINDELLSKLMMIFSTTEANLAKLKETLGPQNSDFKLWPQCRRTWMTTSTSGLKASWRLKVKVDAFSCIWTALAARLTTPGRTTIMTEQYRPFFKAKRRLDDLQKLRDAVHCAFWQETGRPRLPKTSIVEITDRLSQVGNRSAPASN